MHMHRFLGVQNRSTDFLCLHIQLEPGPSVCQGSALLQAALNAIMNANCALLPCTQSNAGEAGRQQDNLPANSRPLRMIKKVHKQQEPIMMKPSCCAMLPGRCTSDPEDLLIEAGKA